MANANFLPYTSYLLLTSKEGVKPFTINFSNAKDNQFEVIPAGEAVQTAGVECHNAEVNHLLMNRFRLFHFNKIYNLTFNKADFFANFLTNVRTCPPGYVTFEGQPKESSNDEPLPFTLKESGQYYNLDQMEEASGVTFNHIYFVSKTAVDAVFPLDEAGKLLVNDFFLSTFLYHRDLNNQYYFLFKSEAVRKHFLDTVAKIHPALRKEVVTIVSNEMHGAFDYSLVSSYQELHLRKEGDAKHRFYVLTSTNAGNAKYFKELSMFYKDKVSEEEFTQQLKTIDSVTELYQTKISEHFIKDYLDEVYYRLGDVTGDLYNIPLKPEELEVYVSGSYSTAINEAAGRQALDLFTNQGVFAKVGSQEESKRVFVEVPSLLTNPNFVKELCTYLRKHLERKQKQSVLLAAFEEALANTEAADLMEHLENDDVLSSLQFAFYFVDKNKEVINKLAELFNAEEGFKLEVVSDEIVFLTYDNPDLPNDIPTPCVAFKLLEKFKTYDIINAMSIQQHYNFEQNYGYPLKDKS